MNPTEEFKYDAARFPELHRQILLNSSPLVVIAGVMGLVIGFSGAAGPPDGPLLWGIITLVIVLIAFGLYRGVNIQRAVFTQYRLTFGPDAVLRQQGDTPDLAIAYADITRITHNANDSFTIKADSALNVIGIPPQMADYDRLEARLNRIQPVVRQTSQHFWEQYSAVAGIGALGLMAAVFLSYNRVVVGLGGTALLAVLGYSYLALQRTKNIDNTSKRGI